MRWHGILQVVCFESDAYNISRQTFNVDATHIIDSKILAPYRKEINMTVVIFQVKSQHQHFAF